MSQPGQPMPGPQYPPAAQPPTAYPQQYVPQYPAPPAYPVAPVQGYPVAPVQGYPVAPQQQQYPQQQPYPPGYPQPFPPAAGPVCRVCGGMPAVDATIRAHRGMVVMMQFRHIKGPFCRDCGIATVRKMASATMWQGWWGYFSFLATPVVLIIDLVQFLRLYGLPEAVRPPGSRPPLDKGRSVFLRPGVLGLLFPVLILLLLATAIASG